MRGAVQELTESRRAQYLMGTVVEIAARAPAHGCNVEPVDVAMREFERLEGMFNRFDPDSELSTVNRLAANKPVEVSEEFFSVVSLAEEFASRSHGSFSHTLGRLIRLWAERAYEGRFPDEAELDDALMQSDFRLVELDSRRGTVAFARSDVELDLGGLVKGYAVDRARQVLLADGVETAFISAGTSSIGAIGAESEGQPWKLGLRDPVQSGSLLGTVKLTDRCVSTSGTSERSSRVHGRIISHLIHPTSGLPFKGHASATALCPSAMIAEVVSKMLLFLGCERALEICDENGWTADGLVLNAMEPGGAIRVEYAGSLDVSLFGKD